MLTRLPSEERQPWQRGRRAQARGRQRPATGRRAAPRAALSRPVPATRRPRSDLKSPNLLVDDAYRVKIADFNVSRALEGVDVALSSGGVTNPRWLVRGLPALPGLPGRGCRAAPACAARCAARKSAGRRELMRPPPWRASRPAGARAAGRPAAGHQGQRLLQLWRHPVGAADLAGAVRRRQRPPGELWVLRAGAGAEWRSWRAAAAWPSPTAGPPLRCASSVPAQLC